MNKLIKRHLYKINIYGVINHEEWAVEADDPEHAINIAWQQIDMDSPAVQITDATAQLTDIQEEPEERFADV